MKTALKILGNKYALTFLAFAIWCLFFDQNDFFSVQQKQRELDALNKNIAFLNNEVAQMNNESEGLKHDHAKIEQYAREQYHMKRKDEDVYLIDNN
ncbi:MAG: septum formation initiator family protein [Chitinophagia bacterium]|nr:septum formation initiator family protein [Chitinophagia bacterium]